MSIPEFIARRRDDPLYAAWLTVFVGVFLTGLGSMWYHLDPGNEALFWDRLAMTIGFMGLVAVVLGEYISIRLAIRLFVVFLAYAVAKTAEVYDRDVYTATQLISGHTLKHLLAALGLFGLVVGLRRRQHV